MPTSLVIDFPGDGLVLVNRQLERFAVGMASLEVPFEAMAQLFAGDMKDQFDSEGASASGGWKELSPAYAEQKLIKFPGKPILQATGKLVESLTSTPLGVQVIGPQEMKIGTDVPYANYHQAGTKHMPARPPIALNAEQRTGFVKVLQEYLVRLMKGATV